MSGKALAAGDVLTGQGQVRTGFQVPDRLSGLVFPCISVCSVVKPAIFFTTEYTEIHGRVAGLMNFINRINEDKKYIT